MQNLFWFENVLIKMSIPVCLPVHLSYSCHCPSLYTPGLCIFRQIKQGQSKQKYFLKSVQYQFLR